MRALGSTGPHVEVGALLLNNSADPNLKNGIGYTPYCYAIRGDLSDTGRIGAGRAELAGMMLAAGAEEPKPSEC